MAVEIFFEATKVQSKQGDLQNDECVGLGRPAPDDPQNITHDEAPKPYHAPTRLLGAYEPRGYYGHKHCRPLQPVQTVQKICPLDIRTGHLLLRH